MRLRKPNERAKEVCRVNKGDSEMQKKRQVKAGKRVRRNNGIGRRMLGRPTPTCFSSLRSTARPQFYSIRATAGWPAKICVRLFASRSGGANRSRQRLPSHSACVCVCANQLTPTQLSLLPLITFVGLPVC